MDICVLLFITLLSLAKAPEVLGAEYTSAFWYRTIPSVRLPHEIEDRFSPLQSNAIAQFLRYIKDGTFSSHSEEFCEAAGILCNNVTVYPNGNSGWTQHSKWSKAKGNEVAGTDVKGTLDDTSYTNSKRRFEYFREKQLVKGGKMVIQDVKNPELKRSFLPHALSSQLPFSTNQLPELLAMLKIDSTSPMAHTMASTLELCESVRENEIKKCATSVEDMVLFAADVLGGVNLDIVQTSRSARFDEDNTVTLLDVSVKSSENAEVVACHDVSFPYSVYYCHSLPKTKSYQVSWEGLSGETVTAAAVCHMDTARFLPSHPSFAQLHMKPGDGEVCHWIYDSNPLWISA